MDSLNLDIDSYTPFDLQNLFTLSPGFSSSDVNKGKIKLLQQLEKTKSLGSESKRRIAFFIDTASSRLGGMSGKKDDNAGTWAMKENPMDTGSSHFVISDPNVLAGKNATITDGRQAGTDDVPPGWLNPINIRTVMHGLNIDTRFRDNYYDTNASDFAFNLPDTQKKVSNMRIATLDIPMTYYSVDRTRGDSTMLIFPPPDTNNSWASAPTIDAISNYFVISNPSASHFGIWQGEGKYSTFTTLPPPTLDGTYDAGWLLILPNGNYEMAWQGQSEAQDITRAMNSAIAMAQPCIHDRGSGKTYILLDSSKKPYIANGLGGKLVYSVDRTSGRSIFAFPDPDPVSSVPSITGFQLVFPVDHSGNYDPSTNIQLHLGWHLGFRAGLYDCNYDSDSDSDSATSVFSEGICMVCGPRYMYISIDDGNHNSGSNFTAVFAESTLGEHIMTRINLASSMDSAGVFKCASDVGLSNQLNRTREFFGPVDISRLKIRLLDEYGRVINLNHMDWSMSLVFEKLYD